jgi:PAS domain S-box-containing protein
VFGWPSTKAIGQPVSIIVPPSLEDEDTDLRRRALAGEVVRAVETVRARVNGTPVRVLLTQGPFQAGHAITGIVRIVQDLSTRQRAELEARRLAAIVESSEDAIVGKNLKGIVTSWNAAAERIFGYTATEMIGTSIRRLIPEDRQMEEDETLAKIRRGERIEHFETIRRRKDGSLVNIALTISPIRDGDGTVVGASKIARDISEAKRAESERIRLLHENATVTAQLNKVGRVVASGLDRESIVQAVTDAATELTGAQFGAFFYNVSNSSGESYTLYTISGVPREAFSQLPMPRNTAVFEPTFRGTGMVRSDDITKDPRYGHNAPYHGMPAGHLPVRSYLAVPVLSHSGEPLGGLFFGHSEVGQFSDRHERLAVGVASWASVALQNAALYISVQEASRLKDHFLATLSHELRTPLNAILGYARMLGSGMLATERQGRAIQVIERNATSLTQIVEDVLDVSRIVSGKMRLNVQSVDLPDIVRNAVDAILPAADAKTIRVETVLDPRATPVSGDPERLQQILWNLLSNAVKFTKRGGKIQVRLGRVDSHVEINVSDTGIGIAPAFLPHIFERFRQADAGPTREHGGLGLGLAIARQLAEMHGGTIDVFSDGPGKGATFRVSIPLMIVHSGATVPHAHPISPSPLGTLALPSLDGLTVLVVDDDRDALMLVSEILEAARARVIRASSGSEALDTVSGQTFDVLVADLGMPQMDGFQLIERIRKDPDRKIRDVPAAALTAFARSEDRVKALRSGFHVHLAKPIDPAELVTTIAMLGRHFEERGR